MSRKSSKAAEIMTPLGPPPRRGRPPQEPRTKLAHWLRDANLTAVDFTDRLVKAAKQVGHSEDAAPRTKALLDSINGKHWPHPYTIFLVRQATNGDVDLEHWVRDFGPPGR